jgi:hypothetical protein
VNRLAKAPQTGLLAVKARTFRQVFARQPIHYHSLPALSFRVTSPGLLPFLWLLISETLLFSVRGIRVTGILRLRSASPRSSYAA